jgi:hypothetical protein
MRRLNPFGGTLLFHPRFERGHGTERVRTVAAAAVAAPA